MSSSGSGMRVTLSPSLPGCPYVADAFSNSANPTTRQLTRLSLRAATLPYLAAKWDWERVVMMIKTAGIWFMT